MNCVDMSVGMEVCTGVGVQVGFSSLHASATFILTQKDQTQATSFGKMEYF